MFYDILNEGERIVGEWMFQAHGTIYDLSEYKYPWFPFDWFDYDNLRYSYDFVKKIMCVNEGVASTPARVSSI